MSGQRLRTASKMLVVPAGLALQLDALVAGGKLGRDLVHQLLERRLNADRDAAGNDLAGTAEKFGQGDALNLGLEVPDRVFERGLGHAVAAHLLEEFGTTAAALHIGLEQPRSQFGLGDDPGGVDHLVAEVGVFAGDALAPGGQAVGFELDQQDAAAGGQAEAGLKRMSQRHIDLAQVNGIDVEHVAFRLSSFQYLVVLPGWCGVDALLLFLRLSFAGAFVPVAKQKAAVAAGVAFVADDGKTTVKRRLKRLAVAASARPRARLRCWASCFHW